MEQAHAISRLLVVCLLVGVLPQVLANLARLPSVLFPLAAVRLEVALAPGAGAVVRLTELGVPPSPRT